MKHRKFRLEEKFTLIIFLVGVLSFGLLGVLSYKQIGTMVIEQRKNSAMGMATVASGEIDGDLFESITSTEDEAYQIVYDSLAKYRSDGQIGYIYAMKEQGDELAFVVDTDLEEPADFLEAYEYLDDMRPAFAGQVCADKEITSDKWGSYFSAYGPIFNSNHEVVGIVGCDIEVENINHVLRELRNMIILLVTFFAVVAVIAYLTLSGQLMRRDFLTEVPNYDSLVRFGNRKMARKKLKNYTGILMDIKDFKYMNQQTSSNIGDEILREYAAILREMKHRGEMLASMGSDNFYVLLKKGREQEFLDSLSEIKVAVKDREEVREFAVHTRCGLYAIQEDVSIKQAVDNCSHALASTKKSKTERYIWFNDSMLDAMLKEKDLLNAFHQALEKEEFQVYYQPKVDLVENRLCGAEALVRWFRDGKMIPPNEFIPVLEANDQIVELDFYVFEQVCKDLKDWYTKGLDTVRISSNFSKLHLKDPDFSSRVLAMLLKYDVNPKYVEIELTESSGYQDFEALTSFVDCMTEAKVATSIDDFGTGYSSLSMLRDLDVDIIKLDRSFFRNVDSVDPANHKMVEHVIQMIQDLEREVVCEGIETKEQAAFLMKVNSPIVQGFLFDKPLPHDVFEKRLKNPVYKVE